MTGAAYPSPERVLAGRLEALNRFRAVAEPYVGTERMSPIFTASEHARQRLAFSPELTVVALAGPTGSGKSSVFNALAGRELSPVGVRRPTTGVTHACVWGRIEPAAPLLDWLRVPWECRFPRERALGGEDQARLQGLVLLDLPDFDSVEREHAAEVERLLGMVDLVVWVLDPQKYADRVVHESYLRPFRRHRDVTVVVLNQADMLSADDAVKLLEDLHELLVADGLSGVPSMATSAVDLPAGVAQLQAHLTEVIAGRQAAWQRLAADVDAAVEDLADLVGPPVAADAAEQAAFGALADGLAEVAGVASAADAVEAAYRRGARAALSSPLLRWLVRRWDGPAAAEPPAPATSTGARLAVRTAVRTVASRASDGLPPPWPEAVALASRSRLNEIPGALAAAVTAVTAPGAGRHPWWWRLVGAGQWLVAGAAVVGLCWLAVGWLLQAVALPVAHPQAGPVPVPLLLVVGGVLAGGVVVLALQPLLRWAARRTRTRARQRLLVAVAGVGGSHVVAPVREVLHAYAEARAALHTAAGM